VELFFTGLSTKIIGCSQNRSILLGVGLRNTLLSVQLQLVFSLPYFVVCGVQFVICKVKFFHQSLKCLTNNITNFFRRPDQCNNCCRVFGLKRSVGHRHGLRGVPHQHADREQNVNQTWDGVGIWKSASSETVTPSNKAGSVVRGVYHDTWVHRPVNRPLGGGPRA